MKPKQDHLTERQRRYLLDIGENTWEVFGADSTAASLSKRGLVTRSSVGMRWWRVRRTAAGRAAVGVSAPARPLRVSAGPMGGPGSGPVR